MNPGDAVQAHQDLGARRSLGMHWGTFQLTDEARACIVRSADFAAAIGSPVLTIHLYAPVSPDEFRSAPPLDEDAIQQFLRFYALTCLDR